MIEQDAENINLIKIIRDLEDRLENIERFALTSQGIYADFLELGGVDGALNPGEFYSTSYLYNKTLAQHTAVSAALNLPGLVGLWTMANWQSSNPWILDSGGLDLHLTGSNVQQHYQDKIPCANFGVAGSDYAYRADEADFDIVGNETVLVSTVRGLTMGAWIRPAILDSTERYIMGKWNSTGSQKSYSLRIDTSNQPKTYISTDGSTNFSKPFTTALALNEWEFVALSWSPSTFLRCYKGGIYAEDTTSVPATLHSGSARFDLGSNQGTGSYFNGQIGIAFLCRMSLDNDLMKWFYNQTKTLYYLNP